MKHPMNVDSTTPVITAETAPDFFKLPEVREAFHSHGIRNNFLAYAKAYDNVAGELWHYDTSEGIVMPEVVLSALIEETLEA